MTPALSTHERCLPVIKLVLNPEFIGDGDKKSRTGGGEIATIVVETTGGWEKFQEFTMPVKISNAGKHDVALVIERGTSKEGNALVNIDWFELGFNE